MQDNNPTLVEHVLYVVIACAILAASLIRDIQGDSHDR